MTPTPYQAGKLNDRYGDPSGLRSASPAVTDRLREAAGQLVIGGVPHYCDTPGCEHRGAVSDVPANRARIGVECNGCHQPLKEV